MPSRWQPACPPLVPRHLPPNLQLPSDTVTVSQIPSELCWTGQGPTAAVGSSAAAGAVDQSRSVYAVCCTGGVSCCKERAASVHQLAAAAQGRCIPEWQVAQVGGAACLS